MRRAKRLSHYWPGLWGLLWRRPSYLRRCDGPPKLVILLAKGTSVGGWSGRCLLLPASSAYAGCGNGMKEAGPTQHAATEWRFARTARYFPTATRAASHSGSTGETWALCLSLKLMDASIALAANWSFRS